MGIVNSYAPGRVEWLGNHTDYNEGYVLSAALDVGTDLEGKKRDDNKIIVKSIRFDETYESSLDELAPLPEKHWANYVLGVVAEFIKRGYKISGFEVSISGKVPIGAGLASSAALEVSTAIFLKKLFNIEVNNIELAKMAQSAEHNYVGVKCGLLDQITSIFSKEGKATFIDFRSLEVKNVDVAKGYDLVIVNSGVKHALVAGEYNERRQSCENAAKKLGEKFLRDVNTKKLEKKWLDDSNTMTGQSLDNLRMITETEYKRAKHIVDENKRVLEAIEALKDGDITTVGRLMNESHRSSQQYFENSCVELDYLVLKASELDGCLGSRLSGGGFGGATINLVKSEMVANFGRDIIETYKSQYGIEPMVFITKPSGGAE